MTWKGRYNFHYCVGYPPELFDLKNDPEKLNDLVGDLRFAETPRETEAALRTHLDRKKWPPPLRPRKRRSSIATAVPRQRRM